MDDNQTRILSIPVAINNATSVHTLINTYWGKSGPHSYATVEFFGTGAAYASFSLIGGIEMRDFNQAIWTNASPTSSNVSAWSGWLNQPTQRLDKQQFFLPGSFIGESLTEIRLTDTGGYNRFDAANLTTVDQRTFVAGVTAETADTPVPEPSSIALLGMGMIGLVGYRLRRLRRMQLSASGA